MNSKPKPEPELAVCLQTDDPKLLIVGKSYPVIVLDGDLVRVIDEKGEAALYPLDHFQRGAHHGK